MHHTHNPLTHSTALEGTFGGIVDVSPKTMNGTNGIKQIKKEEEPADEDVDRREYRFLIMDTVTMIYRNQGEIEVEWEGNMINDGIADAVMSVLLNVESSPAAVKRESITNMRCLWIKLIFMSESSKLHAHSHHDHDHATNGEMTKAPPQNPHANTSVPPAEKLSRLMMFLEAQFGADNVAPIAKPRLAEADGAVTKSEDNEFSAEEKVELARLHEAGIPVPGIEVKVDKMEAKVWLETLTVECSHAVLRDRVAKVVERAVECVSGLWV